MAFTLENKNGRLVAVDDQGNEVPVQFGDTEHESVNTDSLIIGGTLFEEDGNSPIDISSSNYQYTVANDYDEIVVIPDPTAGPGQDQLRVNGDNGSNYQYIDNADTETTGQTQFDVPRLGSTIEYLIIRDIGSQIRIATPPADGTTGQTVAGRNANLGGNGVNTFRVIDSGGTARDYRARVFGRDI